MKKEKTKPHSFCETPNEKCTMNYCDDNGCQNRKRELLDHEQESVYVTSRTAELLEGQKCLNTNEYLID
jgi:hypothetical protein